MKYIQIKLLIFIGLVVGQNPCEGRYIELLTQIKEGKSFKWSEADRNEWKIINQECRNYERDVKSELKIKNEILSEQRKGNPCFDDRYLKIREKKLEEMTDREYNYFILKEQQCDDFKNNRVKKKFKENRQTSKYQSNNKSVFFDIGNELLNILNQEEINKSSTIYGDRRCDYDGERLLEYNSTTKLTSDGKFMKGLKCSKCGRIRYFEE